MSNSNDRSEYKVGQLAALAKVGLGTVGSVRISVCEA